MRNFAHTGKETPGGIATKFCLSVDIYDVITCATFCDDRLRAWQGVEFPVFPLTCVSVDIHNVITCATFCDDRLRGLGWQGVEFPVFPLTCVVARTTLSHYGASV